MQSYCPPDPAIRLAAGISLGIGCTSIGKVNGDLWMDGVMMGIERISARPNAMFLRALALFALLSLAGTVRLAAEPKAMGWSGMPGGLRLEAMQSVADDSVPLDRGLFYSVYRVEKGDTIGAIAEKNGITTDSIVSFNDITNTRAIRTGSFLKIPSQTGVLYRPKKGDTVEAVATTYSIPADSIVEVNQLSRSSLEGVGAVFLPDARLPSFRLREINGDLFRWPTWGGISSRFGWRTDPFSGVRSFHNGLDIASNMGTSVRAAMEGRIRETGYSPTFGNYILIGHHSGYASFYGHLSSIGVRQGQSVGLGQQIGLVGSTGYSTGPHLHFTVFKYGSLLNPANLLH
jgi:murein DD-endopeptidase MepM/ murein hydrolase activator NlpD